MSRINYSLTVAVIRALQGFGHKRKGGAAD